MARKMGLHYDRIDIAAADSKSDGAIVPTDILSSSIINMIETIVQEPTCVIPSAVYDPYLESVLE